MSDRRTVHPFSVLDGTTSRRFAIASTGTIVYTGVPHPPVVSAAGSAGSCAFGPTHRRALWIRATKAPRVREVGNRDAISLLGRLSSGLLSILIAPQFPSLSSGLLSILIASQFPSSLIASQFPSSTSQFPSSRRVGVPRGGFQPGGQPFFSERQSSCPTRRLTAGQPGDGGVSRRHPGRSSFFLTVTDFGGGS